MTTKAKTVSILMADDDEDDCFLMEKSLRNQKIKNDIHFVHNGRDLLRYLRREGIYTDVEKYPFPGLVLLDLNMPIMSGIDALKEIKEDPILKNVPVIIMTTSKSSEDLYATYNLGANSFIQKPLNISGLTSLVSTLSSYWLEIVELPETPKK